jgi:hypothetical protein
MKNNLVRNVVFTVIALIFTAPGAHAKASVVGDIILQGKVERSGQLLATDTSVFEGDAIRTEKSSGAVLRIAHGRVEIGESSEIEIVRQNPVRIVLKNGTLAFNFPPDAAVEIATPQLEIHPNIGDGSLSGVVTAIPQTEDRVQSRNGPLTIVEKQKNGAASHIMPGQILVATLIPTVRVSMAAVDPIPPALQGPIGGPAVANLTAIQPDVRVARVATPTNYARVNTTPFPLGNGDFVKTLNGRATVTFDDRSVLTLSEGTTIQIQQRMQAGTISRRITQAIGSMWFSITRAAGTQTTLETPTAVAAIRGTEGTQDVPNDTQSTHALNDGVEQITEVVTSQSVTIRSGQRVTAIRGVGFTPIVALLAAIAQPTVGAGGGGNAAGGGGAGGGAAGTATGATTATASTVSTVATITAAAASAGALTAAAIVPVVASRGPSPASSTIPLNPPGGR